MKQPSTVMIPFADRVQNIMLLRGGSATFAKDTISFGKDKDGLLNEDPPGGINLDRNFPAHWEMDLFEPASGDFAVSELETRAFIEFCFSHPNIAALYHPRSSTSYPVLPAAGDNTLLENADKKLYQSLVHRYQETARITSPKQWQRFIPPWIPIRKDIEKIENLLKSLQQMGDGDLGAPPLEGYREV